MQPFTTYADYDFRNEQSLMLMEDLFWELPYSTYTFYDYLAISESLKGSSESVPFVTEMTNLFNPANVRLTSDSTTTSQSSIFSTIHSDDFVPYPLALSTSSLKKTTLLGDSLDLEESYSLLTQLKANSGNRSNHQLLTSLEGKFYTSSIKAFNNFTTSHEDFRFTNDIIGDYTQTFP
jgi:hypothetical protein